MLPAPWMHIMHGLISDAVYACTLRLKAFIAVHYGMDEWQAW